jgi:hypothetical protein
MFKIRNVVDQGRAMIEARKRKEEERTRGEELAAMRRVYDLPADAARRAELREALAVQHGTPWLAAVVDVARQMQKQNTDAIAAAPGTPVAVDAGYRYSELVRFEAVLLDAVDRARAGVKT